MVLDVGCNDSIVKAKRLWRKKFDVDLQNYGLNGRA
ncbi:MAG: hypothetical protein GDYSWBUE_001426, partial [Candidatus Fervidibacterota bacterium]